MSPNIEDIITLAKQGKTSEQIGTELGCGKNAVLGVTYRAGVKLGELNGRAFRAPVPKSAPAPRKPKRDGFDTAKSIGGKRRWDRIRAMGPVKGRSGYPLAFKVAAVASVLAGKSYRKVAAKIGVSVHSIDRNWMRDEAVLAQAKQLAAIIIAEREAKQAADHAQKMADTQARAEAQALHNAPILAALPLRKKLICERYLNGETLQEIGQSMSLTRERIRQLMARALHLGLDTGGRLTRPSKVRPPSGTDRRKDPVVCAARSERMKAMWQAAKSAT